MSNEPGSTLRILCVDDNELVVSSLIDRLARDPSLTCVGVVQGREDSYQTIRGALPDVVLMDVDMPGVDTFAIVERLAKDVPDVRVIMFSGHVASAFIEQALDAGAWGYLSKNEEPADLIDAIRRVRRGEIVVSKEAEPFLRNR